MEKQVGTRPTSIENQAEVEDNVWVEHKVRIGEDVVHSDHEDGEEEEDGTTSNNLNSEIINF